MNLRGCRAVSTCCYNQTPVTLTERASRARGNAEGSGGGAATGGGAAPDRASPPSKAARKGDNIFFFAK